MENKEYVCVIDNAKFTSKEDLINHLLSEYSLTQKQGDATSTVLKELKEAFPTAHVSVQQNSNDKGLDVSLRFDDCNADFSFYISKNERLYGNFFENSVTAIANYQQLMSEKEKLVDGIIKKFNADKVEIHQIYEDDGYGNADSPSISFSFYVNDEEYNECYEFDGIEQFLIKLEGYFINSIEGDVRLYPAGIFVNGINIKKLASRAKKLKVEITETK